MNKVYPELSLVLEYEAIEKWRQSLIASTPKNDLQFHLKEKYLKVIEDHITEQDTPDSDYWFSVTLEMNDIEFTGIRALLLHLKPEINGDILEIIDEHIKENGGFDFVSGYENLFNSYENNPRITEYLEDLKDNKGDDIFSCVVIISIALLLFYVISHPWG